MSMFIYATLLRKSVNHVQTLRFHLISEKSIQVKTTAIVRSYCVTACGAWYLCGVRLSK